MLILTSSKHATQTIGNQLIKDPCPAVNSDQYLGFDDRVEYVQVKCQHNLAIDQETEKEQNEVGKKI